MLSDQNEKGENGMARTWREANHGSHENYKRARIVHLVTKSLLRQAVAVARMLVPTQQSNLM